MSSRVLISGGTLVSRGCPPVVGWVAVGADGRIEAVGEGECLSWRGDVIDASGCYVMPGVIDDHVHLREPGLEWKGDMYSETRAAVAGGVTSVMDMPNTNPSTVSAEELERKCELAASSSFVNYGFYLGATCDNLEEIKRLDPRSVAGVKVFMGSSTGGMLVDDERVLSAIFAESPVLIAAHCEDEFLIRENAALLRGSGAGDVSVHPLVRSAEACYRSTARAVELADKYGAHLHVLHLSTARELALFDTGPMDGKQITAEACVHHLWFTDGDYARLGNLIKVNPAIKTAADRDALREGVFSGKVDIIATDHAPHALEEKLKPYWDAPSGAPAVQHSLCSMLTLFSPEVVVEKMCHAPARRFGVSDRGFLKAGMWADIAIVSRQGQVVGRPLYKCGWSPLEGARLDWTVEYTFVNGRLACDRGILADTPAAQPLRFDR